MYTVRARTPTRIFPERRGGVALARLTWRVTDELGDRRHKTAVGMHEAKRGFPNVPLLGTPQHSCIFKRWNDVVLGTGRK